MIAERLLRKFKATVVPLKKGDMIFHQGDLATNFHIVRSGKIKMMTYNEEGREFVQGYFTEGQSFGEPPFFNRLPYPASAVAAEPGEIWKCPYDSFTKLLKQNFEIHLELTKVLSGRLVYKSIMLSELAVEEAEHRLTTLISYFKKQEGTSRGRSYKVPFTRQQLADMTGLRVETVIRSIKAMEQKKLLRLDRGGKIIWTFEDS
jgi:CRP-like cAMP-binding protein